MIKMLPGYRYIPHILFFIDRNGDANIRQPIISRAPRMRRFESNCLQQIAKLVKINVVRDPIRHEIPIAIVAGIINQ